MKRLFALFAVCAVLMSLRARAAEVPETADGEEGTAVTWGTLLSDLLDIYENGGDVSRIDADVQALGSGVAASVAEHWKKVYLDPDYRLYLYGTDDPALLDIEGRHAIVVLGYELKNGEMREELKGRCDAAAALAAAFPDSVLVCSGGATGPNNPDGHTEAGMMRKYLISVCGIAPERIHIDTKALTTAQNAVNTFEILRSLGIGSVTLVTSSYHQRWGQVLYNAVAALMLEEDGYSVGIVGNFCYDTAPTNPSYLQDARIAVRQLGTILGLSREEMSKIGGQKKE